MRLLIAVLLLLLGATTADARTIVEQPARDRTRAELTYERSGDELNRSYRDFAVRIYEGDVLVLDAELKGCCRGYAPAGFDRKRLIAVRELEARAGEATMSSRSSLPTSRPPTCSASRGAAGGSSAARSAAASS